MRAATVEGKPNTPLPMMEFTTSATRLQRPIARTSSCRGGFAGADSINACLYHKSQASARPVSLDTSREIVTLEQLRIALLALAWEPRGRPEPLRDARRASMARKPLPVAACGAIDWLGYSPDQGNRLNYQSA